MSYYYILKPSQNDLKIINNYMNKFDITYDVALFFHYRKLNPEEYLINNENDILYEIESYLNKKHNVKHITKTFMNIINNSKNILVYSDYDADGITANTVMTKFLQRIDIPVNIKSLTSEREHGYGMNEDYLKEIYNDFKFDTIIALDHGINNPSIVSNLNSIGVKTILVDHHIIDNDIVEKKATLIFHPGEDNISSGGLSFLLSYIVCKEYYPQYIKDIIKLSQYATISQITDVIEFDHINYLIAKLGYKYLNDENNETNIKYYNYYKRNKKINTEEIKYYLGPILNASSRMGNANASLLYMLEEDEYKAKSYLEDLIASNKERKTLQDKIVSNFKNNKASVEQALRTNLIAAFIDTGHSEIKNKGIIGSIASSLTNTFNLPSIILTRHNGIVTGSCRGTDQFPIYPLIKKYKHLLLSGGGHKFAAGLSLSEENMSKFIKAVASELSQKKAEIIYNIVEINKKPSDIDQKTLELFESLEPFGSKLEALTYGFIDKIVDVTFKKDNVNVFYFRAKSEDNKTFIAYNSDTNLPYLEHNNISVLITYNYSNINGNKRIFTNDVTDNFEEIDIDTFIKKREAQLNRFNIQNNCKEGVEIR